MDISCEQFESLMSFYLDNELGENIKLAFEAHLITCDKCREKYNTFKKIVLDLRNAIIFQQDLTHFPKTYETEISAYADNELDFDTNIKLKKIIINKPEIRKKLENIYSLKLLLKNSFEKTFPKEDFSRNLVKSIYKKSYKDYNKDILFAVISFIILCIVWVVMLYASIKI